MKSYRFSQYLLGATLASLSALFTAHAAEVDLQGEAEVAVTSAFVWRGQVINDEAVVNPCVALAAVGWRLSAWGSWDLTDVEHRSEHSRADITLEYSREWKRQLFSAGSVAYIYHDDPTGENRDTFEAFAGYGVDVPSLPSLTVYYDFADIEGFYATLSVAHSFPLVEKKLALDLRASIGAADENYAFGTFTLDEDTSAGFPGYVPEEASLVDLNARVELPIEIGPQFTLMPGVRYMRVVGSDIKDALDAAGRDYELVMWSLRGTYYF